MAESTDQAWLRAGLNRLVGMRVISSWGSRSSTSGRHWEIVVNDDLTLSKNTRGAKAFVHGAMAASAAVIDHQAAARVLSDSALKAEMKRRAG